VALILSIPLRVGHPKSAITSPAFCIYREGVYTTRDLRLCLAMTSSFWSRLICLREVFLRKGRGKAGSQGKFAFPEAGNAATVWLIAKNVRQDAKTEAKQLYGLRLRAQDKMQR